MSSCRYKVTYFNGRGRAEVIRLLFAAAHEKYEDIRLTDWNQWLALKPDTPFKQIPTLEYDEIVLCQSNAIGRFLAKKFGLAGKTDIEQAQVDAYVDLMDDFMKPVVQIMYEKDVSVKKELAQKFAAETAPKFLDIFNTALKDRQYLVGNNLTWADLHFMHWMERPWISEYVPEDILNRYSDIKEHNTRVMQHSGVKEWIQSRPVTPN